MHVQRRSVRGVRFWAKGNASIRAYFLTTDVELPQYGGTCTTGCSDGFGSNFELANIWQQYELPFDGLTQQGFGTPAAFAPSRLMSMDFQFPFGTNLPSLLRRHHLLLSAHWIHP